MQSWLSLLCDRIGQIIGACMVGKNTKDKALNDPDLSLVGYPEPSTYTNHG